MSNSISDNIDCHITFQTVCTATDFELVFEQREYDLQSSMDTIFINDKPWELDGVRSVNLEFICKIGRVTLTDSLDLTRMLDYNSDCLDNQSRLESNKKLFIAIYSKPLIGHILLERLLVKLFNSNEAVLQIENNHLHEKPEQDEPLVQEQSDNEIISQLQSRLETEESNNKALQENVNRLNLELEQSKEILQNILNCFTTVHKTIVC